MSSRPHSPRPRNLNTGSSRGIGKAIAQRAAERGARVAIHFQKNRAAAEAVLASLPGDGHLIACAELADPESTRRLWGSVTSQFGGLDVLVNNAAAHGEHPPLSTSLSRWQEEWSRILAVNISAPANLCLLAAQAFARAGSGRIVNISSRGAFRGEPEAPAYGASKAALNSLSQSLAKALAPSGVYVYCIAPGWVETEMAAERLSGASGQEIRSQHPLGRVNQPDEVAKAAIFCALDAPAAMTGSILDVNGASYLRT